MWQSNLKRFAVSFAVLVLLQDTNTRLTFKLWKTFKNTYERNEKETEKVELKMKPTEIEKRVCEEADTGGAL